MITTLPRDTKREKKGGYGGGEWHKPGREKKLGKLDEDECDCEINSKSTKGCTNRK